MIKGQLNLFEGPRLTSTGLKINFEKGIDLSEVDLNTPEQNLLIKKGKYIIHPTGETHPFGNKIKSLSGTDFPFIIAHHDRKTNILKPYLVSSMEYPRITLQTIEGKSFHILFHKLVGRSFFKPPENMTWKEAERLWVFHHHDGRKWDYRIKNLKLTTQKINLGITKKKMDEETLLKQAELKGLF